MKKFILISFVGLCLAYPVFSQSMQDVSLVLQQCIKISELEAYYPQEASGRFKTLYVMQHGIEFPAGLNVSVDGKTLAFKTKQQLSEEGIGAFFLFQDFRIAKDLAHIAFAYQHAGPSTRVAVVNLELKKTGENWTVTESKIENQ